MKTVKTILFSLITLSFISACSNSTTKETTIYAFNDWSVIKADDNGNKVEVDLMFLRDSVENRMIIVYVNQDSKAKFGEILKKGDAVIEAPLSKYHYFNMEGVPILDSIKMAKITKIDENNWMVSDNQF